MQTNNYFNFNRVTLLLKQDLLINRTKYGLTILGLGLITYLLSYLFIYSNRESLMHNANIIISYYMVCFVFYMMAIGVVVGTAFPDLTDKIKTSNFLLIPASTFEKFLAQFLLRMGFFIPVALGIFWIAIRLAKASLIPEIIYENQLFDPTKFPYFEFRLLVVSANHQLLDTWIILTMIFGFFSYFTYLFAGTTYFKRYALVKTVIISVVLFFSCILFSMILSNIFYSQTNFFDLQLQTIQVIENLDSLKIAFIGLSLFSWVFFLAIAYFKLKEKEA